MRRLRGLLGPKPHDEIKIEEDNAIIARNQDIRGFDVAVKLAFPMEGGDAVDELLDGETDTRHIGLVIAHSGPRRGGTCARSDVLREGAAMDELHGEVAAVAIDDKLEELDEVGVSNAGKGPKLFLQMIEVLGLERGERLQRDFLARLLVVDAKHQAQAASAEQSTGAEARDTGAGPAG
jgi:hypothetical protein